MRKKMSKKILSAVLAAGMVASLAACGASTDAPAAETTATSDSSTTADATATTDTTATTDEEVSQYTPLKDADGNVYDLGGMEITIRDWWSTGEETEPSSDYEEAVQEYREWIQETYNFTVKEISISDWTSAPADFVDYVSNGGDDNNYVFVNREDPSTTSAMASGMMYDLATLDCLDFSQEKFQRNKVNELYTQGGSTYAMYSGYSEPRTGVYFNKQVLKDAGIDPDSLYDLQASGEWTWDKFDELMGTCQRDTDNDGTDDIYGLTVNESNMTNAAVYSNGSEYVGMEDGKYVYKLEDAATVEALEWVVDMYNKYDNHDPEGANWDYYKEEFLSGKVAFMVDDEYCGVAGGWLTDADFEIGFVMFPTGPQVDDGAYVNCWSNNLIMIPACYDEQKAWNIAFAWNLWTDDPAGYEAEMPVSNAMNGIFDEGGIETIKMMMSPEHGMITYAGLIPSLSLGSDFTWGIGVGATVSEKIDAISETWKSYIDAANGQ